MTDLDLPRGWGQVIYDGYRNRARAKVGSDILAAPWNALTPDDQECWHGAADDLAAYLDRVPR